MEFTFSFEPSIRVPQELVYRRPIPADVMVAQHQNGMMARQLAEEFMLAPPEETLLYLKPHQVEMTCDAAVIITDLDDGTAEWRVELRRPPLAADRGMDRYHVAHGYIDLAHIHAAGVNHRSFARQMADMALNQHNLRR